MAVRNAVGGVDDTAVALAGGSEVPAVEITRLDAGEGRVAAVGTGRAFSRDGGSGSGKGDADDGHDGNDLGEHIVVDFRVG